MRIFLAVCMALVLHMGSTVAEPGLTFPDPETEMPAKPETRISYWGYRHHELHHHKVVEELQKATGERCCDGPHSGECRISIVDLPNKLVLIEGDWYQIRHTTKIAVLDSLNYLKDEPGNNRSIAVVCAAKVRLDATYKKIVPRAYCIGVRISM